MIYTVARGNTHLVDDNVCLGRTLLPFTELDETACHWTIRLCTSLVKPTGKYTGHQRHPQPSTACRLIQNSGGETEQLVAGLEATWLAEHVRDQNVDAQLHRGSWASIVGARVLATGLHRKPRRQTYLVTAGYCRSQLPPVEPLHRSYRWLKHLHRAFRTG